MPCACARLLKRAACHHWLPSTQRWAFLTLLLHLLARLRSNQQLVQIVFERLLCEVHALCCLFAAPSRRNRRQLDAAIHARFWTQ